MVENCYKLSNDIKVCENFDPKSMGCRLKSDERECSRICVYLFNR